MPLKADGTPNLDAPDAAHAGRQAGSHGRVAQRVVLRRPGAACARVAAGRAAGLDLRQHRRQLSQRPAAAAVGGEAAGRAQGAEQQGQPRRLLPADGADAVSRAPAAAQDDPDAGRADHPLRGQRRGAADLHRWTRQPDQRPAAVVVRLLDGPLGRRHAGGADDRPARRGLARHRRLAAHRRGHDHRALPPHQLRHAQDRRDDRRPEGVHGALHRAGEPEADGGRPARRRPDRVHLRRERARRRSTWSASSGRPA